VPAQMVANGDANDPPRDSCKVLEEPKVMPAQKVTEEDASDSPVLMQLLADRLAAPVPLLLCSGPPGDP
jgi:hypothetical protein